MDGVVCLILVHRGSATKECESEGTLHTMQLSRAGANVKVNVRGVSESEPHNKHGDSFTYHSVQQSHPAD